MPLIIEDGSNVSGANSYASLAQIKSFATNRNFDLSGFDNTALTGFAVRAMDYIESFRDRFKGQKTNATQALQWPRHVVPDPVDVWVSWQDTSQPTLIKIDGIEVPDDEIPPTLIFAQCQLVIELAKGVDLLPTSFPNRQVQRQTVGPITTVYFDASAAPLLPAFDTFMRQLLDETENAFLTTVRV